MPKNFRAYLSRPALIATVLLSLSASAQTVRQEGPALKTSDRTFLEKAAKAGQEEVEISRIAAERTSNPHVREYAQTIVSERENANDIIVALAVEKTVTLPNRASDAERWIKRDAKSFDQEYLRKMISNHEDSVKLFEKEAKDGEDLETVAFARKALPRLLQQLQQAKDLQKLVK